MRRSMRPDRVYSCHSGARAISELRPILGLEVTATPKAVGGGAAPFKNVIYSYDLPDAMEDGYVKEPAVGTRANFDPKSVSEDVLERIKLEDGVHYHEHVKVALQTYAKQNDAKLVTPFMLVVTQDTNHARQVHEFVEPEQFFDGRYKGRVIEIHSKLTGEESDENARRLLNIEHDGTTDIVIHVNKLKEGCRTTWRAARRWGRSGSLTSIAAPSPTTSARGSRQGSPTRPSGAIWRS